MKWLKKLLKRKPTIEYSDNHFEVVSYLKFQNSPTVIFRKLKPQSPKCSRCEEWSNQGLSDTCPACDLAQAPKQRGE